MKCTKARKLILLYAGGDLRDKKSWRLEAHLQLCPECRQQAEELKCLLEKIKKAYEAERHLFPEIEEKAIIELRQRIDLFQKGKMQMVTRPSVLSKKLIPVAAFIGGLLIVALVLVFWLLPGDRRHFIFSHKEAKVSQRFSSPILSGYLEQPRYEIFLIIESGVKIYWIIDKNFDF